MMPTKTLAALAVACLAASIVPASAGGLLGNVLSLDGDHDALVNVDLDNVVSDSVGDGDIDVGTNTDNGIGGTADIDQHRLADVNVGGGGLDGLTDGLDLGGLGTGILDNVDLGGVAGPGGIADIGNVLDDTDLVDLGGLGLGGTGRDLLGGVDLSGLQLDVDADLLISGDSGLSL